MKLDVGVQYGVRRHISLTFLLVNMSFVDTIEQRVEIWPSNGGTTIINIDQMN